MEEREQLVEALPAYEVGDEIGRGAWGVVLEARHRQLERRVAIKQLPVAFTTDEDVRARFRAEARVVAGLDHPHIVPVFDFVETDDTCLFVMEFLPGGTLWDRFQADEVGPQAACAVAFATLGALTHAHDRGVLHRDVKPENVMFNDQGVPKLGDFGVAKQLTGQGLRTATGMIMGTPAYMAPEQAEGSDVGAGTDVYAVGAMLYELLSGQLPFASTGTPLAQVYRHVHEAPEPLGEVAPDVPAPLRRVVMTALNKDPGDRFERAAAFAEELDQAATDSYGAGWMGRSGVPVLGTRDLLGSPRRPRPAPPETTPPDSPGTQRASASDSPTAAQSVPDPPATERPAASDAGAVAPPPPPRDTQRPGDDAGARRRSAPGLVPVGIGLGVLVLVLGVLGYQVLGGDGGAQPGAGPASDTSQPAPSVAPAALARFRDACDANGIDEELCTCALDRSREELTPEQFLANDQLLRETGDQITAPVSEVFDRCLEELDAQSSGAAG